MNEIEVIRVEPLEIPANIVWHISAKQQIALKDFYVYIHENDGKMYVNKSVPEKDIEKMIEIATSPVRVILDDDTETGEFMEYVYKQYGYAAYSEIHKYHKHRTQEREKQEAKEKAQTLIPAIKKLIIAKSYDEKLIYEISKAGRNEKGKTHDNLTSYDDVYVFFLGYLAGMGALEEDFAPLEDVSNAVDCYNNITELLEHIDIQEMPRIYGYLKEMYSPEQEGSTV